MADLYFAYRLWIEAPRIRWLMLALIGAAVVLSALAARKYRI